MNFEQFISLINENLRIYIPFFAFLNFSLLLFLIAFNFKELKSFLKNINKNVWLIFLLVILLATFIRIFISPHVVMMFEDEGWYMDTAKNIMEMDKDYFLSSSYKSIGWPFSISLSFLFFGNDNLVAHFTSSFLGILTVFNIFCISLILFSKEKIALWSAFLFSLVPVHIVWSGSVETAVPSVFFVTLALFFSLIYFKKKTTPLFFLSLIALGFASQVRMENYLLIPFFLIFSSFDKKFFRKDILLKIIFLAIISLMIFPNFVNNVHHYIFNDWSMVDAGVSGENWSFKNLFDNVFNYGNRFFDSTYHPLIFTFFYLLGIFFAAFKKKKSFVFLMIWFLIFFFVYFSSWSALSPKSRLFLNFYPIMVLFAGYGINTFLENKKFKKELTFILIFLFLIFSYFSVKKEIREIYFLSQAKAETEIIHLAKNKLPKNCVIVSNLPVMFSGVLDLNYLKTEYFLKKDASFLEKENCVLFFKDYTCDKEMDFDPDWQKNCQSIEEKYKLSPFLNYSYSREKGFFYPKIEIKNFGFYKINYGE